MRALIECDAVPMAVLSMAAPDSGLRALAYQVLAVVFEALGDSDESFREQPQAHLVLSGLRNAIGEPRQPIPTLVALFVCRALRLALYPDRKPMYPIVNKVWVERGGGAYECTAAAVCCMFCCMFDDLFLFSAVQFFLQRPAIDLDDVPLFYTLFNSCSAFYKLERAWLACCARPQHDWCIALTIPVSNFLLQDSASSCSRLSRCDRPRPVAVGERGTCMSFQPSTRSPGNFLQQRRRHVLELAMSLYASPACDQGGRALVAQLLLSACALVCP